MMCNGIFFIDGLGWVTKTGPMSMSVMTSYVGQGPESVRDDAEDADGPASPHQEDGGSDQPGGPTTRPRTRQL